jgi:hypothetical protein
MPYTPISRPTKPKGPVPPVLRVSDVAKILSICRQTVHSLIQCGELKAHEINAYSRKKRRHVRVTAKSLNDFYKARFGQSLDSVLMKPLTETP